MQTSALAGQPQLEADDANVREHQQHQSVSGLCLATTPNGPCPSAVHAEPGGGTCGYCEQHMRDGDPAVYEFEHDVEALGKVLAASRDLPRGYRFAFWGTLSEWDPKARSADWAMDFAPHTGVVDPTPHAGSKLQFASAPGPRESRNLTHVKGSARGQCRTLLNREKRQSCTCCFGCLVALELELCEPVARHELILFRYRSGCNKRLNLVFSSTGICRRASNHSLESLSRKQVATCAARC